MFLAELVGKLPAELILVVVLPCRPSSRPTQMFAAAHVFRQPLAHFLAKRADLRRVLLHAEIHSLNSFPRGPYFGFLFSVCAMRLMHPSYIRISVRSQ